MKSKPRILIVDDENSVQLLLKAMVESFGYNSDVAQDGREALTKIGLGIDLVLLDIHMTGMSGMEVARLLHENPNGRDVPICMMIDEKSKECRLRCVRAGATDYIIKPVDMTELEVRADALLKIKSAQDALKRCEAGVDAIVEQRTEKLERANKSLRAEIHLRRQVEEDIKQENARLELHTREKTAELIAANNMLWNCIHTFSHDLQAPLCGIDCWSQALEEDYIDNLDEQGMCYLKTIRAEAKCITQIIEALPSSTLADLLIPTKARSSASYLNES